MARAAAVLLAAAQEHVGGHTLLDKSTLCLSVAIFFFFLFLHESVAGRCCSAVEQTNQEWKRTYT